MHMNCLFLLHHLKDASKQEYFTAAGQKLFFPKVQAYEIHIFHSMFPDSFVNMLFSRRPQPLTAEKLRVGNLRVSYSRWDSSPPSPSFSAPVR